jgi:hypothetical protein
MIKFTYRDALKSMRGKKSVENLLHKHQKRKSRGREKTATPSYNLLSLAFSRIHGSLTGELKSALSG